MDKIEGIDRMFLSGTRATFTLKKGAKLDQKAIAAALKKQKLEFVSLTHRTGKPAAAAWVAKTPGLT